LSLIAASAVFLLLYLFLETWIFPLLTNPTHVDLSSESGATGPRLARHASRCMLRRHNPAITEAR
jgi:hypothetical protein